MEHGQLCNQYIAPICDMFIVLLQVHKEHCHFGFKHNIGLLSNQINTGFFHEKVFKKM